MNTPSSLYIHVPFCATKCYYCAFNTYAFHKEQADSYLAAVRTEMELYHSVSQMLSTVFVGGGTPSILSADALGQLFASLCSYFQMRDDAEITVECNPGTVDRQKLEVMRNAGVTRLSFGVQSMDDTTLESIGRIHTVSEVIHSYELARELGFENINLDLIFALPNQTVNQWKYSLTEVVALKPEHVSAYNLILEEETAFYESWKAGALNRVPEEIEAEMYDLTIESLMSQGYEHYEISNFAKPGFAVKHNLVYWDNQQYVGLGPGACGYINGLRYSNIRGVQDYVDCLLKGRKPIGDAERLTGRDEKAETIILGLRKREGIEEENYRHRFGESITVVFGDVLEKWIGAGLLEWNNTRLRLTKRGLFLANEVFVDFL